MPAALIFFVLSLFSPVWIWRLSVLGVVLGLAGMATMVAYLLSRAHMFAPYGFQTLRFSRAASLSAFCVGVAPRWSAGGRRTLQRMQMLCGR